MRWHSLTLIATLTSLKKGGAVGSGDCDTKVSSVLRGDDQECSLLWESEAINGWLMTGKQSDLPEAM